MISAPFYPGADKQKPEWLSAVVLRPYHRAGESISTSSQRHRPHLRPGDTCKLRVDVDETDVSKLRLGQRTYVTADFFGKRQFWRLLVQVG